MSLMKLEHNLLVDVLRENYSCHSVPERAVCVRKCKVVVGWLPVANNCLVECVNVGVQVHPELPIVQLFHIAVPLQLLDPPRRRLSPDLKPFRLFGLPGVGLNLYQLDGRSPSRFNLFSLDYSQLITSESPRSLFFFLLTILVFTVARHMPLSPFCSSMQSHRS